MIPSCCERSDHVSQVGDGEKEIIPVHKGAWLLNVATLERVMSGGFSINDDRLWSVSAQAHRQREFMEKKQNELVAKLSDAKLAAVKQQVRTNILRQAVLRMSSSSQPSAEIALGGVAVLV